MKIKRKSTAKPNLVKRKVKGKVDLSKFEEVRPWLLAELLEVSLGN